MESEKDTERYLNRQVKARGGRSYKWVSPGCSGVPDRIIILPGGSVVFVELKSEGKTSTDQQKKRQAELRALGCTVYADIDTKEKVKEVLDRELRAARVPALLHRAHPRHTDAGAVSRHGSGQDCDHPDGD